MLLHDQYAIHRKWWDDDWTPGPNDKDWTDWDFVLADVFQVIQDFTDPESGQLMWYDQSGDVHWDVKTKESGSLAQIDRQREKKEPGPGESYYAVPVFDERIPRPTLNSWAKDLEEEKTNRPQDARNSRPPTREELQALRSGKIEK